VPTFAVLRDAERIARYRAKPDTGPRILFFSGGSALRALSRALKLLTHNSIHLITPFDSGGSSAQLRKAFGMLSVGDLRNRLLALADETRRGAPEIYDLFSYRFPLDADPLELGRRLECMCEGTDPIVASIPDAMRRSITAPLRTFADHMPASFDLRGASIGNLVLAGGYLNHDRDIRTVIVLFSRLVQVRGTVRPIVTEDLHLAATLEDGSRIVGQHLITGKDAEPLTSRLTDLHLVRNLEEPRRADVEIDSETRALITSADLIVFPMGSLYTSVIASLLPRGVGRAITEARCRKVYVPNTGIDPEQIGLTTADAVERIIRFVRRDAGTQVSLARILDAVLVDTSHGTYAGALDLERIKSWGIDVHDVAMVKNDARRRLAPDVLAEILVSLC
jgi:CofD-related protein of GAK system